MQFFRQHKAFIKKLLHFNIRIPAFLHPIFRWAYNIGVVVHEASISAYKLIFVAPMMQVLCTHLGSGLRIEKLPYIRGKGQIFVGDNVYISGKVGIGFASASNVPVPTLKIGNNTFVGHDCAFSMRKGITIGDHCLLAGGIIIQDNDGHPLDPELRKANTPVSDNEAHPVAIKDGAWIGRRVIVLKGVTIGQNSVVGAGSVVTKDIPDDSVAAGNPAKTLKSLK